MKFEFEKPKGCQDCPFCFTPNESMIFDTFNPHCMLKEINGLENTSVGANFGTHPTIDENCPAMEKETVESSINITNNKISENKFDNEEIEYEGYDRNNPDWYWNGDGTVTINGETYSGNCIDRDTMM
jgi:hypothetical protein